MHHIKQMYEAHKQKAKFDTDSLAPNVEEIFRCAQTCTACADACLAEDNVKDLARCIRTNLDCADICTATANSLLRLTESNRDLVSAQLRAGVQACKICANECGKHASKYGHCKACADTCRTCSETCDSLLSETPVRK